MQNNTAFAYCLSRLTDEQRKRLVEFLADEQGLSVKEVDKGGNWK